MINTKTKGELGNRIEYDVEHDLFHPQNVYSEEYITPTFVEYVQKLENINAELKADNDARKFAMAMSEKVEKQLREQIEKMKCCYNCSKWNDGQCADIPNDNSYYSADFVCDKWEIK